MNHYQVLQVGKNASTQEIKQAYRRLVKEYHPDSQHENADHATIVKLNAAYEVLSDAKNRSIYDRTESQNDSKFVEEVEYRQDKNQSASQYYHHNRQQHQYEEAYQSKWLKEVYGQINQLVYSIITPLEEEIEELSADIFDDELMGIFVEYLENCRVTCDTAQNILSSQPNPSLYGGIAAYLYYGLNHINDGIDELERFTMTYEESYLYAGQELFNLALETNLSAREMAQNFT